MSTFTTNIQLVYVLAAACFVVGLHLMNSPATARRGNQVSTAGMAIAVIVTVILLIHEGSWDYKFFIVFALVVWIASFLSGIAFLGPQSGKLGKDVEQYGPDSPQAMARLQKIFLVSRVELVFLLLVVLDMALKPGS